MNVAKPNYFLGCVEEGGQPMSALGNVIYPLNLAHAARNLPEEPTGA